MQEKNFQDKLDGRPLPTKLGMRMNLRIIIRSRDALRVELFPPMDSATPQRGAETTEISDQQGMPLGLSSSFYCIIQRQSVIFR
jgi:hypothetical protein